MLRRLKCNPSPVPLGRDPGAQARVRESVNRLQLAIDLASKFERVQALPNFQEGGDWGADRTLVGFPSSQPIQKRAGKIVAAPQLRAHAHFLDQLRRRLKEIEPQTELVPIQSI